MNERHVTAQAPVACGVKVARDLLVTDPSGVFAPRTHPDVERRTFPMTLRVKSEHGATAMHQVAVALGIPDTADGARFPISWAPTSHRRTLPSFYGFVELSPTGDASDEAALCISGRYTPPLGAPGKVFDAVAGHRLAARSIEDLTWYVAVRLGECAASRRETVPFHPAPAAEPLRDRPAPETWLG
jgi:hypothetical protein